MRKIKKQLQKIKRKHLKILPFIIWIIILSVIAYFSLYPNPTKAETWNLQWGISRNNNDFITKTFWDWNPSSNDIIKALYGSVSDSTTTYTKLWNWYDNSVCLKDAKVKYLSGWENIIPNELEANTIYVLNEDKNIISYPNGIWMSKCSAIIWKNDKKHIYSKWQILEKWILNIEKGEFNIIDNLYLDWESDGFWWNHQKNRIWIGVLNFSNNTINNNKIYNNLRYWIFFDRTNNNLIENIQSYNNNNYWISFQNSKNNFINNSQIYQNIYYWIRFYGSSNSEIKNSQSYNNSKWIIFDWESIYNLIDNSQTHNNKEEWIHLYWVSNNIIKNSQSYNNKEWIFIETAKAGSKENIINNSQIYNNNEHGIHIYWASNNIIKNSQSYNNNKNGIYLISSSNNNIDNSQSYNNENGIYLDWKCLYNTINNSQFYNNNKNGIYFNLVSKNLINNSKALNNKEYWINFQDAKSNVLHKVESYNNNWKWIYLDTSSSNNKYFGENRWTLWWYLIWIEAWANDFASLWWDAGNQIERKMSWDYVTNPVNTNWKYLSYWSRAFEEIRWKNIEYTNSTTQKYSYGSGISLQIQPVIYSWTELIESWSFNDKKYIGSDVFKVEGDLVNIDNLTLYTELLLTWLSTNDLIDRYSIFGNLNYFRIWQNINTSTWIELTNSLWQKLIITQLSGNDYFATHFQKDTKLESYCEIWRDRYIIWVTLTWYANDLVACGDSCDLNIIICDKDWKWSGNIENIEFNSCAVEACDCETPRWWTINNGESIAAYENSSVACGSGCVSEIRTCSDWVLSGSFEEESCSVDLCDCEIPNWYNWYQWEDNPLAHGYTITWFWANSVACWDSCISGSISCEDWNWSEDWPLFESCIEEPYNCSFEGVEYSSWDYITWYQYSSVNCNNQCELNTITCENWTWNASISLVQFNSCSTKSCNCTFKGVEYENWESTIWYQYPSVDCEDSCQLNIITCENWFWNKNTSLIEYWDCYEICKNCRTPWWERLAHEDSVMAFLDNSVACWRSCLWQTRTCYNWELDWFFEYESCSVDKCNNEYHSSAGNFCDYYNDAPYLSKWVFQDTVWHRAFNYIENMRLSCLHRGKGTYQNQRIYYPNEYIKKSEILKTLVKIMWVAFDNFSIQSEDITYSKTPIFSDVNKDNWFVRYSEYAFINWLTNWFYKVNNNQKLLYPNEFVTRKDIVKKIIETYIEIYGDINLNKKTNLVDLNEYDPYYNYIRKAESLWIIQWVENYDGNYYFQWNDFVTRAQFAKMISVSFGDLLFDK